LLRYNAFSEFGVTMPIYEYRCGECGFQKEFLQRMNDAPLTDCPGCGKPALQKMVSAAGFQLKGTGWYVTDFRDKAKPAAKADKSEKPAEAAKPAEGAAKETPKAEAASAPAPAKSATEKA
jgi:putative FmdB family regulatory protein